MKIVYLPSAVRDVAWFRHYYKAVFPAGDENARKHFLAMQRSLSANPYIGHPSQSHKDVYELPVARTPFTVIYRVRDTQIEVLRLWDQRRGGFA